ncbi:aminomethyltransferase [Capsulimonas corticalis]|uniref:Aminomethyltransferase n=1 Tax=Capsulimonas corticalis TaxID=2219043 RepID=A0A402CX70_9BACT|nr:glycine cleavage system aminomethyltransferase GcvT [Capsulimonas corticalis]BDI32393.1 aminomethyltransferase [Capsulimonas corticalis]
MKQTSLHAAHKAAGATMVDFAGWDMPVSYAGTVGEIAAVRGGTGLFDVSHMGEARVRGAGALAFVQRVTANNASKLAPGAAQYSLLLNPEGGIIDDIIVYRVADEEFLIVLNAGCKDKDWAWLVEKSAGDESVTLTDESDQTALIAAQGPTAVALVAGLVGEDAANLERFHFAEATLDGVACVLSRTGYTGEDGFEIFCAWDDAPQVWETLVNAGAVPAGLGARDVLRLEAAYPLYGHELNDKWTPWESGVGWAVKTKKGDFVGRDAIVEAKPANSSKLVGLQLTERGIPRENCPVFAADGERPLGIVTSGTFSPTVKAGIAMAHLNNEDAEVGTSVLVDIRGRKVAAQVVTLPFYRNGV